MISRKSPIDWPRRGQTATSSISVQKENFNYPRYNTGVYLSLCLRIWWFQPAQAGYDENNIYNNIIFLAGHTLCIRNEAIPIYQG